MTNNSDFEIANLSIICDQLGESGKRLSTNRLTITKTIPAKSTVKFGPLQLGWKNQQATSINCIAHDADIIEYATAAATPAG